ncbi:ABC transporter ATP-binding protein [Streptomyces spectabilis]|uniref:ABC transporter ATP-binding protein n=1 Tax=Streptomyces spectabilis TaxID=68270 RepID=A0A5P2X6F1_STRST|nr:ABC transporter ATP-binding protein [Streptomyces spectabilis]MBB5109085.1 putative ABC transport system ATP-binding protein [Streptomyces spectabilis]MCI3902728.1 ABC transporter ATP-binding protein [Streptomyces spectabilis]QEV60028.1 ABC transporter ATP-binding protein [Streptomyces spectabilis]GGV44613.1 ABC transporter ATP-binding protein [Streptomyces spectabilis]
MGLRRKRQRGERSAPPAPEQRAPHTAPADWAVELRGVRRQYGRGTRAVHALRGVDLALPRGSFTAVMGPSGSGKSTFLQCAAGLDRPTGGTVHLGGTEITGMGENKLTALRRTRLGFVFQAFNLLPSLTVEQNVLLPMRLAGHRPDHRKAADVLARVGLGDKGRRRPGQLSGGQQQRVAIARALVTEPDVVFADEPTGALDTTTAAEILGLLRSAVDGMGATVVMVTHDPAAAAYADRTLFLADGAIVDRLEGASAALITDRMRALTVPAAAPTYAGAAAA